MENEFPAMAAVGLARLGCGRLFVPEITAEELMHDAFSITARDGAANLEVCLRLQSTFDALDRLGDEGLSRAASRWRRESLDLAEALLPTESQRRVLKKSVSEAP